MAGSVRQGDDRPRPRWCAVLTISSGHSARYLTDAVATGRENYYTGAVAAGEPPGRWYGAGAESLGLVGLVDEQDMRAVYERFLDPRDPAFRDPARWDEAATLGHAGRRYVTEEELYRAALDAEPNATPERQAELHLEAGKRARKNVTFLDATFSVQKSITVLHAAFEAQEVTARRSGDEDSERAWTAHRVAVEEAIWAGNRAGLDYLARHAGYSRVGHHGGAAGRFVDAHDFVIASFFQHDSRDHDPQLHIHNAILNRVAGPDGVWRTLDSRALHRFRGAAAAVAERTTEEHLTRTLGVRFASRPDGKAREVLGVRPEVTALFSSRRRAITATTVRLVGTFQTRFGRAPNALELDRLQRQATFATRRAKSHAGEDVEARLDRWDRELRAEVAGGLAAVARDVLAVAGEQPAAVAWSRGAAIETALAELQARSSTWNAPDLTRALSDALPDHLGDLTGRDIALLLDGLTAEALPLATPLDAERPAAGALPDGLRLADGRSAYDAPGGRRYATPAHLHVEGVLVAGSTRAGARAVRTEAANQFVSSIAESGIELGVDQAAAVRGVLTSGAQVETLIGPAGTGKSFVVGVVARAWQDPGLWPEPGRVVGLASSQIATEILAAEGLDARNIARWLGTQRRLAEVAAGDRLPDPRDEHWRLRAGDLVVVDESAMTDTADLAAVHEHARASGAKLLLVGDHRQLAAVGAGGGMDLVTSAGRSYELTEARRFTESWEASASLRLREGDPASLQDYYKHGRLRDCGSSDDAENSAARAWLADTLAGQSSILIVDTNEQAARLNAELRAELVRLARVNERGVALESDGTQAGVGDLIQARANAWHLAGHAGNRRGPINREQLRVLAVGEDGSLRVGSVIGRSHGEESLGAVMHLPSEYVAAHVCLAYAVTAHAAQGLTVDTAHLVVTPATGAAATYVGLSRGRHANTAHVTTLATSAGTVPGSARGAVHRNPAAVLAVAFDAAEPQRAAISVVADNAAEVGSVRTAIELLVDAAELATAGRTTGWLDALVAEGLLAPRERASLAAEDGAVTLSRLLRRVELAGQDPEAVLRDAVTERSLLGSRQLANVLHHRIAASVTLEPVGVSFRDWTPRVADPRWQTYLDELAQAADGRARQLGAKTAVDEPAWAVESYGPVPVEPATREHWIRRAAIVAAHRELTGHDDPTTPLGSAPRAGQPEITASWCAAWRALGREESARAEVEMSNGQLRIRVRAWEREQAWAPRYVADELATTSQAAATHRATASMRHAAALAATELDARAPLVRQAEESAAIAETLDARCVALHEADHARGLWYAHTAETRTAAERATKELGTRRVREDVDDREVTAQEWLVEHRAAAQLEDPFREITTESDFADVQAQQQADLAERAAGPRGDAERVTTRPVPVPEVAGEVVADSRIPTAAGIAEILTRARAALVEIERRTVADVAREADEARVAQLARWGQPELSLDDVPERTLDASAGVTR